MIASAVSLAGCINLDNEPVIPPPPEVVVSRPLVRSIRPFYETTGTTEALKSIQVRSRVGGFIRQVYFEPGAKVGVAASQSVDDAESAGAEVGQTPDENPSATEAPIQLLYEIEKDEYQAAFEAARAARLAAEASVTVAQASVEVAEAALLRATQDEARLADLRKQTAVSVSEYEKSVAALQSAQGELASAKASVQLSQAQLQQAIATQTQAELTLSYTSIYAPIDGKITKTLAKEGDFIDSGTHLADIVDVSSIYVNFSVSDREALRFFDQLRAAGANLEDRRAEWEKQEVYLARETDEGFPFIGKLNYVDQLGIDPATGTLGLRAIFINDGSLLPGLFVRVRVPAREAREATLIPERSIIRNAKGSFVLHVASDGSVKPLDVKVNRRIDGWAILDGEFPAETSIVIEGLQKAQVSAKVTTINRALSIQAAWAE